MVQRSLKQQGVAWVRSDGSRHAEMPVEAFHGNGLVSELEILRADLVDVLYRNTYASTEYRFDSRISALEQSDDGVSVTMTDGTILSADLVVGGRRSAFGGAPAGVRS